MAVDFIKIKEYLDLYYEYNESPDNEIVLNSPSLEDNILTILRNGYRRRRSIGDLYKILKCDIETLYNTLETMINKDILYSHICEDVNKRVYGIPGYPRFNGEKIDEFGYTFNNVTKKDDSDSYGYSYNRSNLNMLL